MAIVEEGQEDGDGGWRIAGLGGWESGKRIVGAGWRDGTGGLEGKNGLVWVGESGVEDEGEPAIEGSVNGMAAWNGDAAFGRHLRASQGAPHCCPQIQTHFFPSEKAYEQPKTSGVT